MIQRVLGFGRAAWTGATRRVRIGTTLANRKFVRTAELPLCIIPNPTPPPVEIDHAGPPPGIIDLGPPNALQPSFEPLASNFPKKSIIGNCGCL